MVLTSASLLLLMVINFGSQHVAKAGNPNANSITNVRDALIKSLRARASPLSPPPDSSLPVNVKISLKLIGIDSLCPKTHKVKARAYEMYTWNDSRLAWSENDFNASYITLPTSDIWTPDLTIWQNMENNRIRSEDNRAVILPNGEVTVKYPTQPRIACNGTAWDMFTKNSASQQLPATYKCSFDMSSDLYATDVVNLLAPVSTRKSSDDASGDQQRQQPKIADLQWFKPNAVYDVTSFEAKRREMPYYMGSSGSSTLKLAVMKFDLLVKQMLPMAHIMTGSEGSDSGEGTGRRQGNHRTGSNRNANGEADEEEMIE